MRGKRGQFFLLAAVIISAVIISFGAGTNRAVVSDEPEEFYAASDNAQREVAAFLDYAVYSKFDEEDLEDFLDLLARDIEDSNSGVNFAFIYGDKDEMKVKNYGSEDLYIEGTKIDGREKIERFINLPGGVRASVFDLGSVVEMNLYSLGDSFSVGIEEGEEYMSFYTSKDRQVILIMQKERGGEIYVSIR